MIFVVSPFPSLNSLPTDDPDPTPEPVLTAISSSDQRPMVLVPAGPFLMGASTDDVNADADERPQHEIILDAFWIDQFEVAHTEYTACTQAGVCNPPAETDYNGFAYAFATEFEDAPVVNITWEDAQSYCAWVGKRLPTEAEWEKAARGEQGGLYPWGDSPDAFHKAWYCEGCIYTYEDPTVLDDFSRPAPIDSFPDGASLYGAQGMAGNVWEWVYDWYAGETYSQPERINPTGPEQGSYKVVRGGAWTSSAIELRSSYRQARGPLTTWIDVGFRCAMDDDRSVLVIDQAPSQDNSSQEFTEPESLSFDMTRLATGDQFDDFIYQVAWSPDGSVLASGTKGNKVYLWKAGKSSHLRTLWAHSDPVETISWSPDGRLLASGSGDQNVIIWDPNGKRLRTMEAVDQNAVLSVAFSPDGSVLAVGGHDDQVTLWDPATGEQTGELHLGEHQYVETLDWSPAGLLAVGSGTGNITIWNPASGELLLTVGVSEIESVAYNGRIAAFSPDGSLLASSYDDHQIALWNSKTGENSYTMPGHEKRVKGLSWSPNGEMFASGSWDRTVILWEAATGDILHTFKADAGIDSISWSPDGSILAAGTSTGILLWDVTPIFP